METVLSTASRQIMVPIKDSTAVGAARRAISYMAKNHGFDDVRIGELALIATEAATNIIKHAGQGEMLMRPIHWAGTSCIEVLAIDSGPGISNISLSMLDGTTTAGSYGIGLGSMRRIANEFDIYTAPGQGTVIAMTVSAKKRSASPPQQIGVVCLPMPGENICGDAWAVTIAPTLATVMVADGLGHGPDAAVASEAAAAAMALRPDSPPGTMLHDVHAALRGTRGAAVAVAQLDLVSEEARFAGIGNIAASVFDGTTRHQLVSHNGIAGSNLRKVQEFTCAWNKNCVLILHSDGLGSRWDLDKYPGLAGCHPGIVAAVMYRDFVRGRDDVTVVVVRENREN